jgi:hypothetical protein
MIQNLSKVFSFNVSLEINNQLKQQEKPITKKINIGFSHLAVLILYNIHMDYAQQFLPQIHFPSLIELSVDNNRSKSTTSKRQLF